MYSNTIESGRVPEYQRAARRRGGRTTIVHHEVCLRHTFQCILEIRGGIRPFKDWKACECWAKEEKPEKEFDKIILDGTDETRRLIDIYMT